MQHAISSCPAQLHFSTKYFVSYKYNHIPASRKMNDIASSGVNQIDSRSFKIHSSPPSHISSSPRSNPHRINSFLYSSHAHTSPIIHTLHSEWIDLDNSPDISPSKEQKMSVTLTETKGKYETPIKAKASAYLTPETESKINTKLNEKLNEKLLSSSPSSSTLTEKPEIKVPIMDVFWAMINNITGKDKMSKVGQYLLRLLIYHAKQAKTYLSDDTINISAIDRRYNDRSKKLNLLANFVRHPMDFARIVVILVCLRFSERFGGVVNGIGMYRQFLRFGKTPFRIRDLYYTTFKAFEQNKLEQTLFTKKMLGDLIGLYYGLSDECLLLFKLGVLTNKPLRKFAGRHESLAWYYDSILGIYTALNSIQSLSQEEMDLKIQIQVKNKAKMLSKQILGMKSASDSLASYLKENLSGQDSEALKEIQYKKQNAYIDLYKWLADFIFDSYTVFHIKLPFQTVQIWLGLIAASLSTFKLYRDTNKRLAGLNK